MKYLLPLSRANKKGAIKLAEVIAPLQPSTRQTEALCIAYARGDEASREHLLRHPALFLRAREADKVSPLPTGSGELLLRDLGALGGIARKAIRHVSEGAIRELLPPEHPEVQRRADTVRGDICRLLSTIEKEALLTFVWVTLIAS